MIIIIIDKLQTVVRRVHMLPCLHVKILLRVEGWASGNEGQGWGGKVRPEEHELYVGGTLQVSTSVEHGILIEFDMLRY